MPRPTHDLTGRVFAGWTVLRPSAPRRRASGRLMPAWLCRCECGVEREVLAHNLIGGHSQRCRSCANRIMKSGTGIDAEAVVRMLLTNEPPAVVAEAFGVTVDTVYKIARARGVPLPEHPTRRRVRAMLEDGRWSAHDMAREIGVSVSAVYQHLRAIRAEE